MSSNERDRTQHRLWEPLSTPAFRMLWTAQLASNIGTWMQTVGAQWVLVSASSSAAVVASVQTAATLPILLLALPAGTLADLVDRRRLLMLTQTGMALAAAVLAIATFADELTPAGLLLATFCIGVGVAANTPAWQAVQPDVVPPDMVATAATLSGVSINLARALGPALGGVIVASFGPGWTFTLNALSFLIVIVTLGRWHPVETERPLRERMRSAMLTGVGYVLHSPPMRTLLLRTGLWMVPSSILFALLPVISHADLHLGPTGYGLLLGSVGCGAFVGALVLAPLRHKISANRLVAVATAAYSAALLGVGLTSVLPVVLVLLIVMGGCWIAVLSTLNASAQILLPRWVRARGVGVYVLVLQGGQALGATIWGLLADKTSGRTAFDVAAGFLMFAAVATARVRLVQPTTPEPGAAAEWLIPQLAVSSGARSGKVRAAIEYVVQPQLVPAFSATVPLLRQMRLRNGARRWRLVQVQQNPTIFRESYVLVSVDDAYQHGSIRLAAADRTLLDRIASYTEPAPVATFELSMPPER